MANSIKKPKITKGAFQVDKRGKVTFCNDFKFSGIKRFYILENSSTGIVRAFHGHRKEEKYMFVLQGSAIVCAVQLDDLNQPNKKNKVHRFVLSAKSPSVLHIPGGYANGSRFLEKDAKMIVFSTSSLSESKKDDYRFPPDYWGNKIWKK